MIEFRALGSVELVHSAGHPVASVLAQPKRLALLAYLVLAAPRGLQRRDALLGVFWPESDTERARAALRQALRFLRTSLGEDVLVNQGEDVLGLAADAIRCDVVSFEAALSAGDDEAALALYRGDLLHGFFISDAPAWEHWLDVERSRLRRHAADAAERLATSAAAAQEWPQAAAYARRACSLAPECERTVRLLVGVLDATGDRAGALAEYDAFARRLAADLEIEPAPETVALAARIRSRTEAAPGIIAPAPALALPPDAAPPLAREPGLQPAAPAAAAPDAAGRPDAAEVPTRPAARPRWLSMAAVVMLVVVSVASYVWPTMQPADLQPQRFVVLPFENLTGDSALDPLGRMAADWITQGIAGMERVEVVPTMTLLGSAQQLRLDIAQLPGAERTRLIARDVGAGTMIAGSYYLQDGRLLLQASVSDVASGAVLRALEPVEGTPQDALGAVEVLRARIRAALAPLMDETSHARAGMAPPSYEAYRDYVAGMEAFVRTDLEAALRHMERSAAADSSYPMPLIVTAIVHMNLGDWAASDSVARRVDQMRHQLGPLERSTHEMMKAWIRGDNGAAYETVVQQARLAPGTISHYQVAEQARRLNRPREALRVLQELAPEGEPRGELRGWRPYWRELAWAHHMLGQHRAELKAARHARSLYPDDPQALLHEIRAAAALRRPQHVERLIQERLASPATSAPSPAIVMRVAGLELRAHGEGAAGQRLLERSAEWYASRPAAQRSQYRLALATALYLAGRFGDSEAVFRELLQAYPDHVEVNAHIGLLAARRGDRAEADRIAGWLRDLDRPYLFGATTWWRALIAAQLDQPDVAVQLLHEAMSQGQQYTPALHAERDLEPLRGYGPFRALVTPTR